MYMYMYMPIMYRSIAHYRACIRMQIPHNKATSYYNAHTSKLQCTHSHTLYLHVPESNTMYICTCTMVRSHIEECTVTRKVCVHCVLGFVLTMGLPLCFQVQWLSLLVVVSLSLSPD